MAKAPACPVGGVEEALLHTGAGQENAAGEGGLLEQAQFLFGRGVKEGDAAADLDAFGDTVVEQDAGRLLLSIGAVAAETLAEIECDRVRRGGGDDKRLGDPGLRFFRCGGGGRSGERRQQGECARYVAWAQIAVHRSVLWKVGSS